MSFDPTLQTESDQYFVEALIGPSGGGGNDGSQTLLAQPDGADGEPQVSSPESQKRKAPSTEDVDKYITITSNIKG